MAFYILMIFIAMMLVGWRIDVYEKRHIVRREQALRATQKLIDHLNTTVITSYVSNVMVTPYRKNLGDLGMQHFASQLEFTHSKAKDSWTQSATVTFMISMKDSVAQTLYNGLMSGIIDDYRYAPAGDPDRHIINIQAMQGDGNPEFFDGGFILLFERCFVKEISTDAAGNMTVTLDYSVCTTNCVAAEALDDNVA